MQTFLPYESFAKSARALDDRRLRNQVNEALIILRTLTGYYAANGKKGWPNHPATKMWSGHEAWLANYIATMIAECINRKFETKKSLVSYYETLKFAGESLGIERPKWLGNDDLHASHRSNLLRKDKDWYETFGWNEPDNMEYVWPI